MRTRKLCLLRPPILLARLSARREEGVHEARDGGAAQVERMRVEEERVGDARALSSAYTGERRPVPLRFRPPPPFIISSHPSPLPPSSHARPTDANPLFQTPSMRESEADAENASAEPLLGSVACLDLLARQPSHPGSGSGSGSGSAASPALSLSLAGGPAPAPQASLTWRLKQVQTCIYNTPLLSPSPPRQRVLLHCAALTGVCASSRERAHAEMRCVSSQYTEAGRERREHEGSQAASRYEASAAQHRLLALARWKTRAWSAARPSRGAGTKRRAHQRLPALARGYKGSCAARGGIESASSRGAAGDVASEVSARRSGVRARETPSPRTRGDAAEDVISEAHARRSGYGYEDSAAQGTVWALQRALAGGVRGRGVRRRRPGERRRVQGDPRRGVAPTPRARAADDARAAFGGASTRSNTVWALRRALAGMRQVPVLAGMRNIGAQGGGGARTRRAASALLRARRGALGDTGTKGSAAQGGAASARGETPNLGRCARAHVLPVACCYSCEVFPEAAAPAASPSARRRRARGSVRESQVRTRPPARARRTAAFSARDPVLAVDRYLFSPFLQ
ncbi:hypothetical protein DFH09DRAFT_1321894 [Mycena vulgaris]|nr:hypothetical protein DFH09DRAFT_1321894 [Mycena vulgaris]